MKSILLPTDFSKNSINAINYATELFKDEVCNFYVLNVQKASSFISDDMMVVSSTTTVYSTIIKAAKKSISNIITNIVSTKKNEKHTFHAIVDYDNFIDSINQIIEKYHINLIVMGTKGASGLQRFLFGSNTVRVMKQCTTPLLVIPQNCEFKAPQKVSFLTNHITLYNEDTLAALQDVILQYQSNLTVLHFTGNKNSKEYRHNQTFFNLYYKEATHKTLNDYESCLLTAIKQKKQYNGFDLLAIIKKNHSFLEYLLNNFTEEEIAYSCKFPLLIITKEDV